MHRIRQLNNFSKKLSMSDALVNTVPQWRSPGEELAQGMRTPFGELKLTCKQCSNRLKEDEKNVRPINKGTLQRTWHEQKQGAHACGEHFWAPT